MRLKGKTAIITGAASGMGAEEALLFAREGANVVIADMLDEQAQQVAAEIADAGGDACYIRTDVTSEPDWENLISETVARYGGLDILVNNAGVNTSQEMGTVNIDGWKWIMDVNAMGVYLGTEHAIKHMRTAGGGSIVNIASIASFIGSEGLQHPAYAASKAAVHIFTKVMAVRYGPEGIRVNSVHPGFMPPMRTAAVSPAARDTQIRLTPLRRAGEPIEVAYGVLFLASDEASFITGTELVIDGGFIAQ